MSKARELANLGNAYSDGALSNRNLVINGSFIVSQRGSGRVFGQSYPLLDRWSTGQYQQAGHQQVSVSDPSVPTIKAVRVTSSSTSEAGSGTRMALGQMVESKNCDFLAGKQVTLSFWIRFSSNTVSGTSSGFAYQLNEYDTVDPTFYSTGGTRENNTYISNGSYPTSWTKYTKTITCGSTMKNLGVRFLFADLFNTTNNSDAWYEVTAVQLEVGDTATPFEHPRSYSDELTRCQRFYEKSDLDEYYQLPSSAGGQLQRQSRWWRTTKRTAPSVSVTKTGGSAAAAVGMDGTSAGAARFSFGGNQFDIIYWSWVADAEL